MTAEQIPSDAAERVQWVSVDILRFDPENPRLEDADRGNVSQQELATLLDELYDAREIAASIAAFGYFPSEVLIGIPGADSTIVIVEGNRRLAAVRGLVDSGLRAQFSDPQAWDRVAELARQKGNIPERVPVLVEPSRSKVIATIGYRHISGIEPWEPYQQARYIAERIDEDGLTPKEVAELTGIGETQVKSKYRNYGIARAAQEAGADPALIQESFGVWDAAMGRVALRQFIGAPDPSQVRPQEPVVSSDRLGRLSELVGWLFGPNKKIRESRDLGALADVVGSDVGLHALREGRSLAETQQAMRQPRAVRERVVQFLSSAAAAIRNAGSVLVSEGESESVELLNDSQVQHVLGEIDRALEPFHGDDD